MAAPRLKFYLLPPNYTQATDSDVQQRIDDELLPCVPKQDLLNAALPLTGVEPFVRVPCYSIDWLGGLQTDTLTPVGSGNQFLQHNSPSQVLVGPSGALAPYVVDPSGHQINPTGYLIVTSNNVFDHVQFLLPYPTGQMSLKYWKNGSIPGQYWALPYDQPYLGPNQSLGVIIVNASGCTNPSYEGIAWNPSGNMLNNNSLFMFPTPASGMKATYWRYNTFAQYYAGDSNNWIADHVNMHPDIFVGLVDYPGDDGTINGTPVVQGLVPQFQAVGTYQVDYRDGYVRFPTKFDSTLNPVKANYAYLIGIGNTTNQLLDHVAGGSGWNYQAVSEQVWAGSHNRPWVNHNDKWMPTNVYVNGQPVGQPVTVSPFEVLTVKLS